MADPRARTEAWFVKNGLPYFVPDERAAARAALHPRRLVPVAVAVVLTAVGLAVLLAWLLEDFTMGPATLTFVAVAAAVACAVTALRPGTDPSRVLGLNAALPPTVAVVGSSSPARRWPGPRGFGDRAAG